MALTSYLPFSSTTTPLQATTYLLGVSLFSISFLVFLNSILPFVITDLLGIEKGVGDIVGTLGFVDEIVALVACPVWGLVSDRLGVRTVAVIGYSIIGLALFLFVQARNAYPQLLLARILFAVGATAATTMVTAILPSLTDESSPPIPSAAAPKPPAQNRHSVALSTSSEATITPERYRSQSHDSSHSSSSHSQDEVDPVAEANSKPTTLAGYVGLFTGCGALVALSLFLPLPTRFGDLKDVTKAEAVKYSFYVVGAFALAVAIFVGIGLRDLRGEEGKGWKMLLGLRKANPDGTGAVNGEVPKKNVVPYWHLLREAVVLGFIDSEIAIGYLGGFVARASTVALSLFIPLFVSSFFIREGLCQGDPSEVLSKECKAAYNLAAALTGVAQLIGLICAPLFGYLSSRTGNSNIPLIIATTFGIAGYIAFPKLQSPEFKNKDGRGGSPVVFLLVALIGISQIGAIVCSLGSLGRGVLKVDIVNVLVNQAGEEEGLVIERPDRANETAPLLERPEVVPEDTVSRVRLKGSVAGVYSWCGGAAILLLTKLGGYLFDSWTTGAPFYLMAVFNGLLLVAVLAIDVAKAVKSRPS